MTIFKPTIGLEIHAELKTRTKMFCACQNNPDAAEPNTYVCPICLGHPGAMPFANREAVRVVARLGLALGGTIAAFSQFDRKSYFYPDLPKGYQISQYEHPIVRGGTLEGIRVRRIHLEEDTGKLVHTSDAESGVDFNRAGVPLLELVTEPDVQDSTHAVRFARSLQRILRYLNISDADMEKGHMRVEVNISLAPHSAREHGTKVEIKNINSFRAVEGAIRFEIKRQTALLERGEGVIQETRGWNDTTSETESQRSKESAHDYRYFPEPDLPPLDFSDSDLGALRGELPELPQEKRARFTKEFQLGDQLADTLIDEKKKADFFEAAASELAKCTKSPRFDTLAHYLVSDLVGLLNTAGVVFDESKVTPEHLAHLVSFITEGRLSSRMAKDLLGQMVETGEDPETLIEKSGARLISSGGELQAIIAAIAQEHPKAVEDYRRGKENALQFLIGQAMAKTKGQANPDALRELFRELLAS